MCTFLGKQSISSETGGETRLSRSIYSVLSFALSTYPDTPYAFSEIVRQFLAQRCQHGEELHVSDRKLFSAFRAFWQAEIGQTPHPALLGQFRVTLTELGYRASGVKRPRWHGLALYITDSQSGARPPDLLTH